MTTRLVMVRHGQSTYNAEGIMAGQADAALTPLGIIQAQGAAALVASYGPALALVSDLRRARDTAAHLGHPDATIDARWREVGLGSWTGRSREELVGEPSRDAFHAWRRGEGPPADGEGWPAVRARVAAALEDLPATGTTLVVSHGGTIRTACSLLLDIPYARLAPLPPTGMSVIDLDLRRLVAYGVTGLLVRARS